MPRRSSKAAGVSSASSRPLMPLYLSDVQSEVASIPISVWGHGLWPDVVPINLSFLGFKEELAVEESSLQRAERQEAGKKC